MFRPCLGLILLLASCGGGGDEPERQSGEASAAAPVSSAASTSDVEAARASLRRMQEQDLHEPVLAEIERLRIAAGDDPWVALDDWGISVKELGAYLNMSGPDVDGNVLALDVEREDHPVRILSKLTRDLAARGVTLVVVPIPKRLQIYPDRLPGVEPVEAFHGADVPWATLVVSLLEAGVQVLDLVPDFLAARYDESGEDDRLLFLDYDPHWTPRGMEIAAERIAARIRELEGIAETDVDSDLTVGREAGTYSVRCPLPEGRGDVPVWYRPIVRADGRPALFRDPESPVLFLGDSFSARYRGEASDLPRHVCARTGLRMDVISRQGGAESVWDDLERRGSLAGKRVLVWQFNAGAMGGTRVRGLELDEDR